MYDAQIPGEAHNFNQHLEAIYVATQTGVMPKIFSMAACDAPNVILETVKKAEDSDAMILRMYEAHQLPITAQNT